MTMKTFFLILLVIPALLHAATLRVNNGPDTSPDYTTIQSAINAAVDGDTLLIEGSVTTYAAFTVTNKRLNIIGPGFSLAGNLGTPTNKLGAIIASGPSGSIIRTVSTSGGSANGSLVMGLEFQSGLIVEGSANVTIARCYFSSNVRADIDGPNCMVIQCFFAGSGSVEPKSLASGLRVENCIMPNSSFRSLNSVSGIVVRNNLLAGFDAASFSSPAITIDNNIFTSGPFSSPSLVFRNNLFPSSTPPNLIGSGNLVYSNLTALMPAYNGSGASFDSRYRLGAAPNLALNAGTDGTHIGPFGGANPYVLSGIPPLPTIDELSVPQFAAPGTNLNIRVKVSERP